VLPGPNDDGQKQECRHHSAPVLEKEPALWSLLKIAGGLSQWGMETIPYVARDLWVRGTAEQPYNRFF